MQIYGVGGGGGGGGRERVIGLSLTMLQGTARGAQRKCMCWGGL